jgi:hypothetical protein
VTTPYYNSASEQRALLRFIHGAVQYLAVDANMKNSDRRGFLSKFKLAALASLAGLLTERLQESGLRTSIPAAYAADGNFDNLNVDPIPGHNSGSLSPYGLRFGGSQSGEGIASARTAGAPNGAGLDLYTAFVNRLSITNSGKVGIGTRDPQAFLHLHPPTDMPPTAHIAIDGERGRLGTRTLAYMTNGSPRWTMGTRADPGELGGNQGSDLRIDRYDDGGALLSTETAPDFFIQRSNGNVGLGTDSPNARLHVMGGIVAGDILPLNAGGPNIGSESLKWGLVRAALIQGDRVQSGDLIFKNGFKFTEGENGDLLLLNGKNDRIARFDEEGNLHISGKIVQDK